MESFNLWSALGKPRIGNEYDNTRRDKRAYKYAIRTKESRSANQFSDSLNMAKKIESLEQRFSGLDTKVDNMCKLVCTQTECEFHLRLFTNHLQGRN